jgi:hypothetical protein
MLLNGIGNRIKLARHFDEGEISHHSTCFNFKRCLVPRHDVQRTYFKHNHVERHFDEGEISHHSTCFNFKRCLVPRHDVQRTYFKHNHVERHFVPTLCRERNLLMLFQHQNLFRDISLLNMPMRSTYVYYIREKAECKA